MLPDIGWPTLKDLVGNRLLGSLWKLQKVPLVSQLLAEHIRSFGGDGIIYPSTKLPDVNIFALFLKDDIESRSKFTAEKIESIA